MDKNFNPFALKPYAAIIKELEKLFTIEQVQSAYKEAIENVKDLPPSPGEEPQKNIWTKRSSTDFCNYFNNWYDFLPAPTGGLGFIEPFTHFYYDNDKAFYFLNDFEVNGKKVIYDWTVKFVVERGKYMDTPSSDVTKIIDQWINDPGTHIEDYIMPIGGYKTFNEFFTRDLRPGARPVSAVGDDSVVVAPADSELNMINSVLTESSKVNTKGSQKLGVKDLLNGYVSVDNQYSWKDFLYGTALSCVLLPNNYHHYHAPVTGELIHSEIVPGIYFGIEDAPEWFHEGNVGDSDADFSIFEQFHRGVFVFKTNGFGLVAMVPVGLNTISGVSFEMSSVNHLQQFVNISANNPVQVYKGEKLGYFKYGGSLNILLFQKGCFPGIEVHQGQRIGTLSKPEKSS